MGDREAAAVHSMLSKLMRRLRSHFLSLTLRPMLQKGQASMSYMVPRGRYFTSVEAVISPNVYAITYSIALPSPPSISVATAAF